MENEFIKLKDYQQNHYEKLCSILKNNFVGIDTSSTGSGKTVISIAVAKTFQMSLLVICPPILKNNWIENAEKYNVKIFETLSYQQLRGSTNKELSHGKINLLIKDEEEKFYPTKEYMEIINKNPLLIVFDEAHWIKNEKTRQLSSCHALIRGLINNVKSPSRALLLSATPADKEEHAFSYIKMLGISWPQELYVTREGSSKMTGFKWIYERAKTIDKNTTNKLIPGGLSSVSSRNVMKLTFQLYTDIFRNYYTSQMIPPKREHLKISKSGFFTFPEEDDEILQEAYNVLSKGVVFSEDGEAKLSKESFGRITGAFVKIERAKLRTIIRLALEKLNENINNKVIIYLNYRKSIEGAHRILEAFNPMVLDGRVSAEERKNVIKNFQLPDSRYRIIISQPRVGGVGISLDDNDGNFPRTQIFSPNYDSISISQALGRTYRASTKSDAYNIMVFSKKVPEEYKILNALAKKAMNTSNYRAENNEDINFGDWPKMEEDLDKIDIPYKINLDDADEASFEDNNIKLIM